MMHLQTLKEPRLLFARGEHICPRHGIAAHGVFDSKDPHSRRATIRVGAVGDSAGLEALQAWIEKCRGHIDASPGTRQARLFPAFSGMRPGFGFDVELVWHSNLTRPVRNVDIAQVVGISSLHERIGKAVDVFYEEVKFLAEHREVDVIVCVVPDALHQAIAGKGKAEADESLEATVDVTGEMNFRRALKAKAMHLSAPLQLIRAKSLKPDATGQQDPATKAWNFCTALYYKSGPKVPWKLASASARPTSCAVGIAFYRSRDYQSLNTSLAQVFDELGHGLILRGTPVNISQEDRNPHLSEAQAQQLLRRALEEYRIAMKTMPARVVVHKSSRFTPEEIAGFDAAAQDLHINTVDFVTILDSRLRIFRQGNYPPYRGTLLDLDGERHLLYTRGSVWFYETYPGMYIPEPIELRIVRSEETPLFLANEVLGLTKMNWNNTQFDGKYPVTLGCARKVGEVLKYLGESDKPQSRYSYYM